MARETKSKQIGSHRYEVTQLGAIEGRAVLAHLMQLFGGMVSGIAGGGKPDMVSGFTALASSITPDRLTFFCDTFSPWTQVHKGPNKVQVLKDIFDDHFAANYAEMMQWLAFCLEVNFASFLGESGALAGFLRVAGSSDSPSPKA
jgi:hypothetical protein